MKQPPRHKMIFGLREILSLLLLAGNAHAQILELPPRPADAQAGSEFAQSITNLDRAERESKIYDQIALGNVPEFLRHLCPVHVELAQGGHTNSAVYYVTPDYLAIGSDADYCLMPLTPIMAQRVADLTQCSLPTRKMVNDIYAAAAVKLVPAPIPPSPIMATVPIFIQHDATVHQQRKESLQEHPLGALVAGDKKDVVISEKLLSAPPGKVAIYGWHKMDGRAIQPLYTGHGDTYADYSHGIRLAQLSLTVNGATQTIPEVLANPALAGLLSDEGLLLHPRYPTVTDATNLAAAGVSGTNHEAK